MSAEAQNPISSSLVVGRIQFLVLRPSVSRGCPRAVHYIVVSFLLREQQEIGFLLKGSYDYVRPTQGNLPFN